MLVALYALMMDRKHLFCSVVNLAAGPRVLFLVPRVPF